MVDSLLDNLYFVGNVLKTAMGIGFVIFIHELGHFLLAKWNGVKVERFSIGFLRPLLSYRKGVGLRVGTYIRPPGPGDPPTWGETEYVLAVLPLGGYVKMLGENIEESTEEAAKSSDPRAYHNKSVWARMQIITAGVIMNILLGIACFAFVFSQGTTDLKAKVGEVVAGAPAYKAGLRPGDEVVAIDGRRDVGYTDLVNKVRQSGAGQKIRFTIKRQGVEGEKDLEIEPLRDENDPMPTIGVRPMSSLSLASKSPYQPVPGKARPIAPFDGESRVVAVGPEGGALEPVEDYEAYLRISEKYRDRPLAVEVEQTKELKDGRKETSKIKATIPAHPFFDFGLKLTPGPIVAVRPGSPAEKAGLKQGDRIVAFDGDKDYDPMTLPDRARDAREAGKPVKLTVERPAEGKPAESIEATLAPDSSFTWVDAPADPGGRMLPLDVPTLGLALAIVPKIRAVAEGSPAARAGIKPGGTLRSMIFKPARKEGATSDPRPVTIELDGKSSGWPVAYSIVQQAPWKSIQLSVDQSEKPITVDPEVTPSRFHPVRGLEFTGLIWDRPPLGLADSLRRGVEETYENVVSVFRIFKSLAQGRVGRNAFGGILPIVGVAYSSASQGWTTFVHFLGFLSVNLAVLNFLPIPPLDGGQFLFLSAEKVRGKPLPEAALNSLTLAGVVFVVGLILFINGNDIYQIVKSYLT